MMPFQTRGSTIAAAAAIINALDGLVGDVAVEGTLHLTRPNGAHLGCRIVADDRGWTFETGFDGTYLAEGSGRP